MADPLPPVFKPGSNRKTRALRLLGSCLDPRSYLHAFRLLNYYNYTHVVPRRQVALGHAVALSPTVSFANPTQISIGDRTHIGAQCSLWAGPVRGRIDIGPDCLFGPGVFITAANYRFRDGTPVAAQRMQESHVLIGPDVWIGAGAMILPGLEIGTGAVIGAGAIVSNSVPPGAIVAGPAAVEIGHRHIGGLAA